MTLKQWLEQHKILPSDLARTLDVHKSTIGRVLAGTNCSWDLAKRIEAETGGEVTAAEVMDGPHDAADESLFDHDDAASPPALGGRAA